MPTYDPNKPPGKYPMVFAEALWKAVHGGVGQKFRTSYKEFPPNFRRLALAQELSGFKASLRNHPAHPLSGKLKNIRTRIEWEGLTAVIVTWKEFRPSGFLEGILP